MNEMASYAKIENGIVTMVIEATPAFIAQQSGTWVETFEDGSQRYNYAGIGYTYDPVRDAFIPPQPYPSWILNESTCNWEAPVPMPPREPGKVYEWNESLLQWVLIT